MSALAVQPLIMGQVSGVFGIKGWVRVFDYSRERGAILVHRRWLLRQGEKWQEVAGLDGRRQGKGVVAHLDGCDDRDQALTLIGMDVAVDPQWLELPQAGEYFWYQLEGLEVINLAGESLGRVDHLIETGANDVLVLSGDRERLIPYGPDVIRQVDLETGQIEVDWDKHF